MKPTKLDYLTSFACVGFFTLAVGMGFNPHMLLESRRDDERERGVRMLYAAVAQLEAQSPEQHTALVSRLKEQGEQKVVLGIGDDCSGYWGRQCSSGDTAEGCFDIRDFVDNDLLPAVPISPGDTFSQEVTGYYLQFHGDDVAVGACDPSEGKIVLPAN